jgi:cystathionine beta-lyase/cystathionine gamma-synthase
VAEFLRAHDAVQRVHHPAFADATTHRSTLAGFAGMFSFEPEDGDWEDVRRVIDGVRRFRIGVSWGGVESLIITPDRGTNSAQLDAQRIPRGLIRISVGLEGADVLIEDLDRALRAAPA